MKNLAFSLLLTLAFASTTFAKSTIDNQPLLSSEKSAQIILQARELSNTLHLNEAEYLKIKEVLKFKFIQIENARISYSADPETQAAELEKLINKRRYFGTSEQASANFICQHQKLINDVEVRNKYQDKFIFIYPDN